jgi:DNA modification methylase/ParB-like chromosome segregation protein Spo0J
MTLIIDPEFAALIPPLQADEYEQLKASLLADGCRDALVVWKGNGILVDGHNRYKICSENRIAFNTVEREFTDRDAVADWMIDNQLARRNLTPDQARYLRGKKYNQVKKAHGGKREASGKNFHLKTRDEIATETGVTGRTITNDGKYAESLDAIAEKVAPDIRQDILSGNIQATVKDVHELADIAENNPQEAKAIVETVKTGKAETVKEAKSFHTFLKGKEQQFIDFVLRHQIREMWRMERFYHWFENNHSEYSKFAAIEFSGVLHIDDNDNVEVLTVPLSELLEAEKRWAKIRQVMELEAKKADDENKRSQMAIQVLAKVELPHYVNGNCLDLLPTLPDKSIRLLLTDPPYGVDFQSNRRTATAKADKIAGDNPQDAAMLLRDMLASIANKMADDSRLLVFTSQAYYGLFRAIITEAGYTSGRTLTWVKENHGSGNLLDFAPQTEWIINAWKGKPSISNRISEVLDYRREHRTSHPTEKPTQLMMDLIKVLTLPDELVVDPFAGTGVTVEAALRLGRKAYGIELSSNWYNEGVLRLQHFAKAA